MASLVGLSETNQGQCYTLTEDETTIGRDSDCQVVINDPAVGRKHAVIRRVGTTFMIEALGSRRGLEAPVAEWNKLSVNNEPVECWHLKHNDRITIGSTHLYKFLHLDWCAPEIDPRSPLGSGWQPGDRIEDRWEVKKVLSGGMGVVYIVLDHETGEHLAAKTYRDDVLAANPELHVRFEREALAWIKLDPHPNVVTAKYVKIVDHKPLLFLEFVDGWTLRKKMLPIFFDKDALDVEYECWSYLELARQFCDGMIHISKCGIRAHRDIKADNCLVANERWPILKITDFGLAKVFDDVQTPSDAAHIVRVPTEAVGAGSSQSRETVFHSPLPGGLSVFATRTGVGAGTASHMAPEQFDDVKRVDVRADIYSFGVTLFKLFTGKLPFSGPTWLDYRRQHQTAKSPELHRGGSALKRIVTRCLAKDPSERFADFHELRKAVAVPGYDPYETYLPSDSKPPAQVYGRDLTEDELLEKALSLVELGRHGDALQAFNQTIERNPMKGRAWAGKGLLLVNVFRRFDEALASLEQAQRLGEHGVEEHIVLCQQRLS